MKMKAAVEGEHFTVGCCSEWGGRSFFLSFRWEMLHYTEEKGAFTEAVRELLKRYSKCLDVAMNLILSGTVIFSLFQIS